MKKPVILAAVMLVTVILFIPAAMVSFGQDDQNHFFSLDAVPSEQTSQSKETMIESEETTSDQSVTIPVYRNESQEVEDVPLVDYVIGVVASEMPVAYELEALKAQSLAAQTYVISQQLKPKESRNLPGDALVSDTVEHQVFQNQEELKERWGADFEKNWGKVEAAVAATTGQVIMHNEKPITAAFFSTSNGYTENSEDYWMQEIPYLKSVESPWDVESPRYAKEQRFPITEFEEKLGVTLENDGSVGIIHARTEGGRVETAQIGEKEFTGRHVRETLGIDSSDFSWHVNNGEVVIQTKGWGHGVGMSQFGANGMAKEGSTYKDIINHYYSGVTIESIEIAEMMINKSI